MTEDTQASANPTDIQAVAHAAADGRDIWIVVRDGFYSHDLHSGALSATGPAGSATDSSGMAAEGYYYPPVFWATLDEDKAREQAQQSGAALVRLPVTEDYREIQVPRG